MTLRRIDQGTTTQQFNNSLKLETSTKNASQLDKNIIDSFKKFKELIPNNPDVKVVFIDKYPNIRREKAGKIILTAKAFDIYSVEIDKIEQMWKEERVFLFDPTKDELAVNERWKNRLSEINVTHLEIEGSSGEIEHIATAVKIRTMTGEESFFLTQAMNQLLFAIALKNQNQQQKNIQNKIQNEFSESNESQTFQDNTPARKQPKPSDYFGNYKPKDKAYAKAAERRREEKAIQFERVLKDREIIKQKNRATKITHFLILTRLELRKKLERRLA